jgi:hypothetical protein
MSETITVTVAFDEALERQVSASLTSGSRYRLWADVATGVAIGSVGAVAGLYLGIPAEVGLGAVVGLYGTWLVMVWCGARTQRRLWARIRHLAEGRGPSEVGFSSSGVRALSRHGESWLGWKGVDEIVSFRGGTGLWHGAACLTVADAALPRGLTPEGFRERLQQWRAA